MGAVFADTTEQILPAPGDYQERRAGTLKEAVTISSEYTVQYDKNTKAQVEQMPEPSVKYWYEKAAVSEQIPKWLDVPFLGWNENRRRKRDSISREKIFLLRKSGSDAVCNLGGPGIDPLSGKSRRRRTGKVGNCFL